MQSAGQIADLGGGALMAAFGILAALRERDTSGEGQLVDVSMFDGSLSWLAMVAAKYLCDGVVPQRGDNELSGRLICYRPYACADGWVTLGALEPKFWQAWCRGVGREDLIERQFERPGSTPTRRSSASSPSARASSGTSSPRSTTAASSRYWISTRRSTRSSSARARWWCRSTSPERTACACSAFRSSSRAHRARPPAPALPWASTRGRCSPASGLSGDEIDELEREGAVA